MKGKAALYLLVAFLTISTIALAAASVVLYKKYLSEKDTMKAASEQSSSESEEEDTCDIAMNQFTGEEVHVSFEYPATWGEAEENITDAETGGYISGNNFEISFTNNPYVRLYGVSSDFEIGGIGDPCGLVPFFKGNGDIEASDICSEDLADYDPQGMGAFYFGCEEEDLGESAFSYYYGPTGTCAILGFVKAVDIDSPQEEYPGIRIAMTLGREDNLAFVDLGERLVGSSVGVDQTNYLKARFLEIWNGVYDELTGEDYKDYLMQQQLEEFETFVGTVEVSE